MLQQADDPIDRDLSAVEQRVAGLKHLAHATQHASLLLSDAVPTLLLAPLGDLVLHPLRMDDMNQLPYPIITLCPAMTRPSLTRQHGSHVWELPSLRLMTGSMKVGDVADSALPHAARASLKSSLIL